MQGVNFYTELPHTRAIYISVNNTVGTYFFNQTPRLPFFLAARFCVASIQGRPLFEGGIYFLGKPTDINNGWIRYA